MADASLSLALLFRRNKSMHGLATYTVPRKAYTLVDADCQGFGLLGPQLIVSRVFLDGKLCSLQTVGQSDHLSGDENQDLDTIALPDALESADHEAAAADTAIREVTFLSKYGSVAAIPPQHAMSEDSKENASYTIKIHYELPSFRHSFVNNSTIVFASLSDICPVPLCLIASAADHSTRSITFRLSVFGHISAFSYDSCQRGEQEQYYVISSDHSLTQRVLQLTLPGNLAACLADAPDSAVLRDFLKASTSSDSGDDACKKEEAGTAEPPLKVEDEAATHGTEPLYTFFFDQPSICQLSDLLNGFFLSIARNLQFSKDNGQTCVRTICDDFTYAQSLLLPLIATPFFQRFSLFLCEDLTADFEELGDGSTSLHSIVHFFRRVRVYGSNLIYVPFRPYKTLTTESFGALLSITLSLLYSAALHHTVVSRIAAKSIQTHHKSPAELISLALRWQLFMQFCYYFNTIDFAVEKRLRAVQVSLYLRQFFWLQAYDASNVLAAECSALQWEYSGVLQGSFPYKALALHCTDADNEDAAPSAEDTAEPATDQSDWATDAAPNTAPDESEGPAGTAIANDDVRTINRVLVGIVYNRLPYPALLYVFFDSRVLTLLVKQVAFSLSLSSILSEPLLTELSDAGSGAGCTTSVRRDILSLEVFLNRLPFGECSRTGSRQDSPPIRNYYRLCYAVARAYFAQQSSRVSVFSGVSMLEMAMQPVSAARKRTAEVAAVVRSLFAGLKSPTTFLVEQSGTQASLQSFALSNPAKDDAYPPAAQTLRGLPASPKTMHLPNADMRSVGSGVFSEYSIMSGTPAGHLGGDFVTPHTSQPKDFPKSKALDPQLPRAHEYHLTPLSKSIRMNADLCDALRYASLLLSLQLPSDAAESAPSLSSDDSDPRWSHFLLSNLPIISSFKAYGLLHNLWVSFFNYVLTLRETFSAPSLFLRTEMNPLASSVTYRLQQSDSAGQDYIAVLGDFVSRTLEGYKACGNADKMIYRFFRTLGSHDQSTIQRGNPAIAVLFGPVAAEDVVSVPLPGIEVKISDAQVLLPPLSKVCAAQNRAESASAPGVPAGFEKTVDGIDSFTDEYIERYKVFTYARLGIASLLSRHFGDDRAGGAQNLDVSLVHKLFRENVFCDDTILERMFQKTVEAGMLQPQADNRPIMLTVPPLCRLSQPFQTVLSDASLLGIVEPLLHINVAMFQDTAIVSKLGGSHAILSIVEYVSAHFGAPTSQSSPTQQQANSICGGYFSSHLIELLDSSAYTLSRFFRREMLALARVSQLSNSFSEFSREVVQSHGLLHPSLARFFAIERDIVLLLRGMALNPAVPERVCEYCFKYLAVLGDGEWLRQAFAHIINKVLEICSLVCGEPGGPESKQPHGEHDNRAFEASIKTINRELAVRRAIAILPSVLLYEECTRTILEILSKHNNNRHCCCGDNGNCCCKSEGSCSQGCGSGSGTQSTTNTCTSMFCGCVAVSDTCTCDLLFNVEFLSYLFRSLSRVRMSNENLRMLLQIVYNTLILPITPRCTIESIKTSTRGIAFKCVASITTLFLSAVVCLAAQVRHKGSKQTVSVLMLFLETFAVHITNVVMAEQDNARRSTHKEMHKHGTFVNQRRPLLSATLSALEAVISALLANRAVMQGSYKRITKDELDAWLFHEKQSSEDFPPHCLHPAPAPASSGSFVFCELLELLVCLLHSCSTCDETHSNVNGACSGDPSSTTNIVGVLADLCPLGPTASSMVEKHGSRAAMLECAYFSADQEQRVAILLLSLMQLKTLGLFFRRIQHLIMTLTSAHVAAPSYLCMLMLANGSYEGDRDGFSTVFQGYKPNTAGVNLLDWYTEVLPQICSTYNYDFDAGYGRIFDITDYDCPLCSLGQCSCSNVSNALFVKATSNMQRIERILVFGQTLTSFFGYHGVRNSGKCFEPLLSSADGQQSPETAAVLSSLIDCGLDALASARLCVSTSERIFAKNVLAMIKQEVTATQSLHILEHQKVSGTRKLSITFTYKNNILNRCTLTQEAIAKGRR